jgi:hypothetical protein
MDFSTLRQLKSKFVARNVSNELVLVPLTGNVAQMNEMFTLNETACFIWENCEKVDTLDAMCELMLENFDVDAALALTDIKTFLAQSQVLTKYL